MVRIKVIHPFVSGRDNSQRVQPKHRLLIGNRLCQLGLPVSQRYQRLKIAVGLVEPLPVSIGSDFGEVKGIKRFVFDVVNLIRRFGVVVNGVVVDLEAIDALLTHEKVDGNADADFVIKDIAAFLPATLATGASIAFQVNRPQFVKFLGDHLAKAVILPGVQECTVADEPDNPVVVQPVPMPTG